MKSSDERLGELFQTVRDAPVELPLQDVEGFVSALPEVSPPSDGGVSSLISGKTISMISVLVVALSAAYLLQDSTPAEVPFPQEVQVESVGPVAVNSASPSETEATFVKTSDEEQKPKELVYFNDIDAGIVDEVLPKQSSVASTASVPASASGLDSLRPLGHLRELDTLPSLGERLSSRTAGTPPPELSNRQMKKLKKSLYLNLYQDGLITSDTSTVYLKLPGSKVLINDVRLSDGLAQAYSKLTNIAGYGEHRGIKLSPELILIGDFVDEEFKGSGVGLFPPKPIADLDMLELEKSLDRLAIQADLTFGFDDEWHKLDDFAKEVLAEAPMQEGKKRLLSIDRTGKEMSVLYQMLHEQLLRDEFILSASDYVILGLGAKAIYFNGIAMIPSQEASYRAIMSTLRIKPGANRMIRMNDKVIGIGDFNRPGNFSGTIWTVRK
ncbi:MAG: hypothetical protein AB8F78_15560 [Saprospiraceae bacterium]